MDTPLRVLGAIRLSQVSDETTSPARQRDRIEWWTEGNDGQLVDVTEDLGVSGAVAPFDRVGLGPWLTDERAGEWDVLAAWKLDRISRSAVDTLRLLEWCDRHSKRIVCVDDGIDTATQMGRVWLQLAAIFAQVERTAITERVVSSRAKLRSLGRWTGGPPVYGMTLVTHPDGAGYAVARDPAVFSHLRFIVDRVIAGDSLNSVATALNKQGVLAPSDYRRSVSGKLIRGACWRHNTIRNILTSRTLLGEMSHEGLSVKGMDGMPVLAGEAAITLAEWKQLHALVVDNVKPRTRTAKTSLLLDIARCGKCGAKLYRQRAVKRDVEYLYYRCANQVGNGTRTTCSGGLIRAKELEDYVTNELLGRIGSFEVTEKVLIPGDDIASDLADAVASLEDLSSLAGTAKSKSAKKLYAAQMAALDDRISRLENTPQKPDEWTWVGTGDTYGAVFVKGDVEERRSLLLRSGITVTARLRPTEFTIDVPEEVLRQSLPGRTFGTPDDMSVPEAEYWSNIAQARSDDDGKPGAGL